MSVNSITVTSGEELYVSGGKEVLSSGGTVISTYTPGAGDTIVVSNGGVASGLTLIDDTLTVSSGGLASNTIVSNGGILIAAKAGESNDGTQVFSGGILSAGGVTTTDAVVNSGGTLQLPSGNLVNPITVNSGGEILFSNITASSAAVSSSGDTLTVATTRATDTVNIGSSFTYTSGVNGADEEVTITCYCGGTQILTDRGEVAIESIRPDQKVVVRRNGQDVLEPVTWIGKSKIDLTRHAHPELAAPIRVKAGALADKTPARDLLLSPEHCLIINGRCVPVKLLVNGGSIAREYRTEPFDYYHIELEKHGILIAEGAEAESYLDTGNRALFDNADMPRMLHPTFEVNATSERWRTDACAPLASVQEEVAPIWQMLADRSVASGYGVLMPAMVNGPDLHIVADGKRIDPASDRDSRYVFTVPAGVKSVSLASRFCIPADRMIPSLRDTRRLGVSVNWIAIRSADNETILPADHPGLRSGWNDIERAGSAMWRWTNGAATVPWDNVIGSAILTVRCTPVDEYPAYDEKVQLVA